jgi:hypothetical protein
MLYSIGANRNDHPRHSDPVALSTFPIISYARIVPCRTLVTVLPVRIIFARVRRPQSRNSILIYIIRSQAAFIVSYNITPAVRRLNDTGPSRRLTDLTRNYVAGIQPLSFACAVSLFPNLTVRRQETVPYSCQLMMRKYPLEGNPPGRRIRPSLCLFVRTLSRRLRVASLRSQLATPGGPG